MPCTQTFSETPFIALQVKALGTMAVNEKNICLNLDKKKKNCFFKFEKIHNYVGVSAGVGLENQEMKKNVWHDKWATEQIRSVFPNN